MVSAPKHLQMFFIFTIILVMPDISSNSYAINGNTMTTKDHIKDLEIMLSTDLY